MIEAKIIADSISPLDHRLVTFEVNCHRFILSELNTHRAFSRNSASSRAMPVKKALSLTTAKPIVWASEQKGMVGGEEVSELDQRHANAIWESAAQQARHHAEELVKHGVHKSIANRLLEPFMWHRMIITTTMPGLDNFFNLRDHPDAMPEHRAAARAMREVLEESEPEFRDYGQWHMPYITAQDVADILRRDNANPHIDPGYYERVLRHISVARCARVSYLTHDGKRDHDKDLELYGRLVFADPPHASPLEHVATPARHTMIPGNLVGWSQLRHEVFAEP